MSQQKRSQGRGRGRGTKKQTPATPATFQGPKYETTVRETGSKQQSRQQSSRRTTPKKEGVPKTTVGRIIKSSSQISETRVSEESRKKVTHFTNEFMSELGAKACSLLEHGKTKTITQDVLADALRELRCTGVPPATANYSPTKATQIPIASARRALGQDCQLGGKGGYQVAKDAEKSLAVIADSYAAALGKSASSYSANAGVQTIRGKDVDSAHRNMTELR